MVSGKWCDARVGDMLSELPTCVSRDERLSQARVTCATVVEEIARKRRALTEVRRGRSGSVHGEPAHSPPAALTLTRRRWLWVHACSQAECDEDARAEVLVELEYNFPPCASKVLGNTVCGCC